MTEPSWKPTAMRDKLGWTASAVTLGTFPAWLGPELARLPAWFGLGSGDSVLRQGGWPWISALSGAQTLISEGPSFLSWNREDKTTCFTNYVLDKHIFIFFNIIWTCAERITLQIWVRNTYSNGNDDARVVKGCDRLDCPVKSLKGVKFQLSGEAVNTASWIPYVNMASTSSCACYLCTLWHSNQMSILNTWNLKSSWMN